MIRQREAYRVVSVVEDGEPRSSNTCYLDVTPQLGRRADLVLLIFPFVLS